MGMSDVISRLDLALWPQLAMVLFLAVFVAVVVRVYLMSTRREMDGQAASAMSDGQPAHAARSRGGKEIR